MKEEFVIRNEKGNIICKLTFSENNPPVVSIVGRGYETDILIYDNDYDVFFK